jgi:hypothetical protein
MPAEHLIQHLLQKPFLLIKATQEKNVLPL